MSQTLTLLLPILAYLASTAGAGVVASTAFANLREWLMEQRELTDRPRWVAWLLESRVFLWLVESRIGARLTVMVLSACVSSGMATLVALLTGAPVGPALDQALAAIVASQLYHLKDMRGEIAAEVAGFVFTPDMPQKDAQ